MKVMLLFITYVLSCILPGGTLLTRRYYLYQVSIATWYVQIVSIMKHETMKNTVGLLTKVQYVYLLVL